MSTRHIALAGVLTASAIVAGARPAAAQTCWDFSTLDQTHHYRIDEVFEAPSATIEMKNYLWNGNKIVSPAAVAYATQTQISGGPAPEFRLYVINAHIVPDTPVATLSYQFGLFANGGSGVAHANLGVNGELVEVTTGMASLNGVELGDPAIGIARVTVNMLTQPGVSPEKGTVQLQAQSGLIEQVKIGGIQKFIDYVCFP